MFGNGEFGSLGHGGQGDEHVPRLIESALAGKRVVGVAAGSSHTDCQWCGRMKGKPTGTSSFGNGDHDFGIDRLGHGCEGNARAPRLISHQLKLTS